MLEARDMDTSPDRQQLIRILQAAYSGELAAAHAYRGHWKSLSSPDEREKIQQIENEEGLHREKVGLMLERSGARPMKARELRMLVIGRAIGLSCHFIGWFLPMYFAGRIENSNVKEYEAAAFHACRLGLIEFETVLRLMASVEREHELFFLKMVAGHRLLPMMRTIFKWGRDEITKAKAAT